MDWVFQTNSFNPQMRYNSIRLLKPAQFKLINGTDWRLLEKGELELGNPEPND
jgi:hypothetical protein